MSNMPPDQGYGAQRPDFADAPSRLGYSDPAYGPPGASRPARNGVGIAALVLGILALVTAITLIGGVVLGVVAIVLGLVGRGRARRGEATNGGMATTGIVLGLVGILASIGLGLASVSLLNSPSGKSYQKCA